MEGRPCDPTVVVENPYQKTFTSACETAHTLKTSTNRHRNGGPCVMGLRYFICASLRLFCKDHV